MNDEIQKVKAYGDISIDRIWKAPFQKKGTMTAQLRQVVTTITTYPKVQISDGVSDNLFDNSEFDLEKTEPYTYVENRIAFMNVPEGTTVQTLQLKLQNLKDAGQKPCIMKIISDRPILTENQRVAIKRNLKSYEDFAHSQVVRYSSQSDNAGELILNNDGEVMYKRTFFKGNMIEDEIVTSEEGTYISKDLKDELEDASVESDAVVEDGLF